MTVEELIKKAQDYCSNHVCRENCKYAEYCVDDSDEEYGTRDFASFGVAFAHDVLTEEFRKKQECDECKKGGTK